MLTRKFLLAIGISVLAAGAAHAQAWTFDNQDTYWPLFGFHHYGGDVNRPAATPDRPYFHGDDAVPLNLRWRDLDEARAELAAREAAAAAVAAAEVAPPPPPQVSAPPRRRVARKRHLVRHPVICVPAKPAIAAAR